MNNTKVKTGSEIIARADTLARVKLASFKDGKKDGMLKGRIAGYRQAVDDLKNYLDSRDYQKGLLEGTLGGIKLVARTAEDIMDRNGTERPYWWSATLVQCLENTSAKILRRIETVTESEEEEDAL